MNDNNLEIVHVAYLGPIGTYTHEITQKTYPEPNYKLTPFPTIYETVNNLIKPQHHENNRIFSFNLAVIPFENSNFGLVKETQNILNDLNFKSKFNVLDHRLKLNINHCLISRKRNQNQSQNSIKKIFSHVQALGQCKNYLNLNYKHVEKVPVCSTIEAARLVSEDSSFSSLAICSSNSILYFPQLEIIDFNIQDANHNGLENVTTFIVLERKND